jgi:5'-3' exonuclease
VDDYLTRHKVNVELKRDEPFDPTLALMFMLPEQNFGLLPNCVANALLDKSCILRSPVDYYPTKFELDKFETLKYNKHAMIQFLREADVRKVYEGIPKSAYSKEELERNVRKSHLLFYENKDTYTGIEITFNEKYKEEVRKIIRPKYE